MVMIKELHTFMNYHRTIYMKWVNYMICEICLKGYKKKRKVNYKQMKVIQIWKRENAYLMFRFILFYILEMSKRK